MRDFRPIAFVLGLLLITLALGMCVAGTADAVVGNPDWQVFALAASATLFIGVTLALGFRAGRFDLSVRQAFLVTVLAWVVVPTFGALPFVFAGLQLSYADAFFEAMSGITTTGATVIVGLDTAPPGILLWRAVLQWLGGIGIIVMAIAIMPMLRVGGMQLFRMESSDRSDKALPRAAQIAGVIGAIYLLLTVIWATAYWLAGMSGFDAVCHAMTTIATAGFSTRDGSLGYFDSATIDAIATTGMLIGGLPFILYLRALQGDTGALFHDSQVRWFLTTAGVLVLMVSGWLWLSLGLTPADALRYGSLNTVSVMTGTGFATASFDRWGSFAMPLFLFVMVIGGCAGSTTCGIKIFRFQVLFATAHSQLRRLLHPHGIFVPLYNRRPIPEEVILSVLGFFFLFGLTIAVLAASLGVLGLDFVTALSSATTAVANVGPGLGPVVGPAGTFQPLPDAAKWLLAIGMLLGRLELFTVLVLFLPGFWRG